MILAIDLGSTSFKSALFDERLRLVAERHEPLRYRFGTGGRVELAVSEVERAMQSILPRHHRPHVIALTSQAQTFTVVNARGRAVRPFVSWQDQRAGQAAARLRRELPDFAEHCSFADLLPALQISQIAHLPLQDGEMPLLLPTYFVRRWTGENVTDDNLAAMSGLYSLRERQWWDAALRAVGLREAQLPRVIPIGQVAGLTRRNEFGLPVGVPVVLAGNDQTAGAYGARLEENGALLITLGTAQVAYRCVERLPASKPGVVRGPYPGGRFYRMAADAWGGNLINWAETVLSGCSTDEAFFAQAARAPAGCRGLVFDPERGEWRGLGLHHMTADLARSILEALSARMAQLVNQLGGVGRRFVWVAGGGSKQPLWRAITGERLGVRLRPTAATPLVGAARMALAALRRHEG
ncbi:MAG: FGGY-family carbohydrate kinase [Verrucomicrobiae bacterium]|nr:FGGY-family carbohydrate kinase [Verrucomicrobiae bacterium]